VTGQGRRGGRRDNQHTVDKQQVNPWGWQDRLGFSQAWRIDDPRSIVFVSGQAPISPEGELVGEGDFEAQTRQVFENLRTVLQRSGASLESIVKLTVYLTDMTKVREYGRLKAEYIEGPQPASTAIGVASLALPGMMIEVEAIAVP
jgi:2-iminobutanoate/2-iminopropanoate deaminase